MPDPQVLRGPLGQKGLLGLLDLLDQKAIRALPPIPNRNILACGCLNCWRLSLNPTIAAIVEAETKWLRENDLGCCRWDGN